VSARRQPKADRSTIDRLGTLLTCGLLLSLLGCATSQENQAPTSSVQTVQYYPYQVKGYQSTFPKRRTVVTAAIDSRDFNTTGGIDHLPRDGRPAIGAVLDQQGMLTERLYGPPLAPLFQDAVAHAAAEAGLVTSTTSLPLKDALAARDADYVITVKVLRCWVTKTRNADQPDSPRWHSAATITLDAAVYKPPFDVAFWQGQVSSTYTDPPAPVNGVSVGDEAEIYDQPGEVLSVALTRAVAEIFKRDDLHTLIEQDRIHSH
jgi:hypothetical protein